MARLQTLDIAGALDVESCHPRFPGLTAGGCSCKNKPRPMGYCEKTPNVFSGRGFATGSRVVCVRVSTDAASGPLRRDCEGVFGCSATSLKFDGCQGVAARPRTLGYASRLGATT